MKRMSFKQAEQLVIEHNQEHGTLGKIEPNYEYYQLIDLRDNRRQIVRGSLRECLDGLRLLKVEKPAELTNEEIKDLILNRGLTITKVIDSVVEINGFIGVGMISLGDDLRTYCFEHKAAKSRFSTEALMSM